MEAILLAGGLGTRLRSRLTNVPKCMAPVGGRPFLEILLDQLCAAGCSRAILSVGHLRHVVMQRFRESYRGLPIDYVVETSPLGTGGAIRLALGSVRQSCALVLNGDTFLAIDLQKLLASHTAHGAAMTMAIKEVEDTGRYGGVVVKDGEVIGFREKNRSGAGQTNAGQASKGQASKGQASKGWINAGVYVLNTAFPWPEKLGPDAVSNRFSFETDLLALHLARIRPRAFPCAGYFLDIGVPQDLDRAQCELANPARGAFPASPL
ncbi:MAG: nucleotidyltransferase family protein [Terracidiphilus sp.]